MPAKKIGLTGIIFFVMSGLIGIDALAPAAAVGPSVFGWWFLVIILFVIPYVLITCELSSAFPGEGGIYDWTLRSMGSKNAARVSWYYWINVPFWIPSVYLLCGGMIAELFYPEMSTWGMIAIAIVMTWATVFISNRSVEEGALVNAIGAFAKVAILVAFAVGAYMLVQDSGTLAADMSLSAMAPSMGDSFLYAPTLIYMFLGVEAVACMGSNIENPKRNLPLGIMIAIAAIIVLYGLAIYGMIAAIPGENLSLVGGIVQTLEIMFGGTAAGNIVVITLSILAIVGLFTFIIPWVMASSRAAQEAAQAGEMPKVFAITNKSNAPYGANMLTGIVATVALIGYGFLAGSADELFWSLFSFANFLLFFTYFFMFAAFVRLRKLEPNAERAFKLPGGYTAAIFWAAIPSIVLAIASVLFVFPDIFSGVIDWEYSSPTVIALIVAMGFIDYRVNRDVNARDAALKSTTAEAKENA